MAKVLVLKADAASPSQDDVLAARRAKLSAEAAKLNKVAEARVAVERRLAELDAEQAVVDEAERQAWRAWAQSDAEGPPPSPQTAARERIAQTRALLANDLQGALAGQKAIEPRLAALNDELRELGREIYARLVDSLLLEAEEINSAVHEAATAFLSRCEKQDGLRDAVIEAMSRAVNSADAAREAVLRGAYSRIEGLARPMLVADPVKRAEHAAEFRRRLA